MIDLHMHILPGLDDGAGDMEEAIEMARMAADSGVRMAAATPHANLPGMERGRYLQKYLKRLDEFCFELNQRRIPLKVCPGMEIFAAERLEEAGFSPLGKRLVRALKEGKLLTLNHGKYLLVEFPFDFSEKAIDYTLEELLMAGYIPVLAHPESRPDGQEIS